MLWAALPILVLGAIYIRARPENRLLVASRIAVFILILAAAANPYFVQTQTVQSEDPSVTILSDRTGSMGIFDPDVASRLASSIDAQIRSFSGESTPLGDRILQNSAEGQTLVLVSDGYSNAGRALPEALALARASNTTVFAISLIPVREDASVEISGTNTAVLGGEYPFTVKVRSSGNYTGELFVLADDRPIYSGEVSANGTSSIKISHTFLETGNHLLRATIGSDGNPENNQYQKVVYVVPKPEVLLLSESDSPLARDLSELYRLTVSSDLPAGLRQFKAVVIDDMRYHPGLDSLRSYVLDGGGLVVVGGESSFELGGYHNSSLEEVLPVRSTPSTFEGGKVLVLVLDISFSLLSTRTADGTPLLDYEKALAVELLKSPDLQDHRVGLVVFGTRAYSVQDPLPLSRARSVLEERISSLAPSGTENTYLDNGLELAWEMLNESGEKGELIVISDGYLWNYEDVVRRSIRLLQDMNVTARLIQVQAIPGRTGILDELAASTGAEFSSFVYPQSLTTRVEEPSEERRAEEEPTGGYTISVASRSHYITAELELNATVTGFNDVTPKPGSQKLVALQDGKPLLTTWRYGLGRVAALSTDDGGAWAGQLYEAPNSQLISSTVNWAVGDPRSEEERVEAEDGWQGSPLVLTIIADARPSITGAEVEKVGERRYSATLHPNSTGIYYIGGYGVAVNYPLEYRDVGFNPGLPGMIISSGGRVFTEAEAERSLLAEASMLSQRTVQERASRRDVLLLLALMIFLGEVILRRVGEMRTRRGSRRSRR